MRVTTKRVKEIIEERQMYDRLHPEDIGVEGEKENLAKDLLEARKLLKDMQALPIIDADWPRSQLSVTAISMIEKYFSEVE